MQWNEKTRKIAMLGLKISLMLLVAGVLVALLTSTKQNSVAFFVEDYTLSNSWVQIVDGQEVALESLADAQVLPTMVLQTTLPKVGYQEILLFFTAHHEVEVYVEDECIYRLTTPSEFTAFQTPGSTWNEVSMDTTMGGKLLRIELTTNFPEQASGIAEMQLIPMMGKTQVEWSGMLLRVSVACMLCVLAIIAYMVALLWKNKAGRYRATLTADFYLCVGMWLLAESSALNYFTRQPLISFFLSAVTLRMVPVIFLYFVESSLRVKFKVIEGIRAALWANLVISVVLQVFFGVSFLQMTTVNGVVIFVSYLIYAGCYLMMWKQHDPDMYKNRNFVFSYILLIAVAMEATMAHQGSIRSYTELGIVIAIAVIVYAWTTNMCMLHSHLQADVEAGVRAQELVVAKNKVLMRQMKSHFIFNTLNSVSALCKRDPLEADRAIKIFARYMRANMYLIDQNDMVPFEKELELVQAYLEIEKIRFKDSIMFDMQIDFTDFVLPPLTVEPVLENAVMHGIRQRKEGGCVKVVSRQNGNFAQIIIEDNGVGFREEELQKSSSVGLKNMAERVKTMANGRIHVKSEIDVGTVITISIPLEEK